MCLFRICFSFFLFLLVDVAGDSAFTVFMTDYTTYAGIFTCQKLTFAHRQSATILSRSKDLEKIYLDKVRKKIQQTILRRKKINNLTFFLLYQIRNRLSSFGVDPFDLSIVNQTGCPKDAEQGYNIHIDQETFSAANIANVVRKAGEKLGDGVEWTIDASKKVGGVAKSILS